MISYVKHGRPSQVTYWTRFRFRSSSRSSSSFSSEGPGLRICAIDPRLVGGPELSLSKPGFPLSRGVFQDQLFRWSDVLPFVKGGVVGRELSVLLCEAPNKEYELKLSRIRWSSVMTVGPLLGDDGHCADDWPDAKGEGFACHPWTFRISAEVWRRGRLVGGEDTDARGCGGGGGGWTWDLSELGEDCDVAPPIEPYLRGVIDKCDETGGR